MDPKALVTCGTISSRQPSIQVPESDTKNLKLLKLPNMLYTRLQWMTILGGGGGFWGGGKRNNDKDKIAIETSTNKTNLLYSFQFMEKISHI